MTRIVLGNLSLSFLFKLAVPLAVHGKQGCSVLSGNALIRLVGADIASPDLKSPSCQGLTLVSVRP